MSRYQYLLFDVDDTLLDFGAAERSALRRLLEEQGLPCTPEVVARYRAINQELWRAFEAGSIGRDEVLSRRHATLFRECGIACDGAVLDERYRQFLEEGCDLVSGAMELMTALHGRFELYIITNGVSRTQRKRLQGAGLHSLFDGVFVSEETGSQKPMRAFFDFVFTRIPGFDPTRALVIGDSLSADIGGGQAAGLDTVWFNPAQKPNATGIRPTHEIRRLDELYPILGLKP